MIYISHRGNLSSKELNLENNPNHLEHLLKKYQKLHIEIDLWFLNNQLHLGHDYAQYQINHSFLNEKRFWIHCKNISALNYMLNFNDLNFFYHQNDDCTLTSKGYIWTYPNSNNQLYNNSIAVLPELTNWKLQNCFGLCSDYINNYIDLNDLL